MHFTCLVLQRVRRTAVATHIFPSRHSKRLFRSETTLTKNRHVVSVTILTTCFSAYFRSNETSSRTSMTIRDTRKWRSCCFNFRITCWNGRSYPLSTFIISGTQQPRMICWFQHKPFIANKRAS